MRGSLASHTPFDTPNAEDYDHHANDAEHHLTELLEDTPLIGKVPFYPTRRRGSER